MRSHSGTWPFTLAAVAGVLAALACASPVLAADAPLPLRGAGAWLAVGVLGGSTLVDAGLANYQWDVRPRTAWGAQALAGRGRMELGLRAWRSHTVQVLELPTGTLTPAVRSTTLELLGRGQAASALGTQLWAGASTGWLRVDYSPERVTISPGGAGAAVVADFAPVNEWTAAVGCALQRPVGARWMLGLDLDRRFFALDTAHRSGAAVVNRRESFGDWSARLELAWLHPLRVRGASR